MPDELVVAAMSGDRDAVAQLLEVIRPLVARYCRGRTDPVADVPDSVEIGAGPEQRVLHGELSAQLRALLDELPEKQREILVLRIVVGLSAEETAEIVGASPGAVRVAQHRALGKLRKNIPPGLA